jgi:hypothetical protein
LHVVRPTLFGRGGHRIAERNLAVPFDLRTADRFTKTWCVVATTRSRRNPYRPGTESYARLRKATLKRRAALAQATAARAKSPKARGRAKRRARAAQQGIQEIEKREEYRSNLNDIDRSSFDRLSIKRQRLVLAVTRKYPDSVPKDLPDPFAGPKREALWRLSYSTRAGIRLKAKV